MRPLVIIPTFNEMQTIAGVTQRVREAIPNADILIVDDNSPDGTGQWAADQASADPHFHLLSGTAKAGLAQAYLRGFTWAFSRDYTHVCQLDGDGSHLPEDLARMVERAAYPDKPDLVIGSRWTAGGVVENWPKNREILSRGGNLYINAMLGLSVADATAGIRVWKVDFLRSLNLASVSPRGYYFQVEMTKLARRAGGLIIELPITFVERIAGQSKMNSGIILEALKEASIEGGKYRGKQLSEAIAPAMDQLESAGEKALDQAKKAWNDFRSRR